MAGASVHTNLLTSPLPCPILLINESARARAVTNKDASPMQVTLPSNLETFVRKRMHTLGCEDAGEVVRDALLLLQRQEEREQKEARLRQALQEGFDDIAAGRVTTVKVGKELSDFLASL